MSTVSWITAYKPSINSGVYGGFIYPEHIDFHPKQLHEYFEDKNDEYFVRNKLEQTLDHIDFDIDSWYQLLEPLTFDTKFISMSPEVAQSMILFYRFRYCNAKLSTLKMSDITKSNGTFREKSQNVNPRFSG